jgi:hypothetical protein
MSRKNRKNKQKATPKVAKAKKMLTPKQARFVAALMHARTRKEAALIAGYSQKNIDQSANQAFNAILLKAPEAMGECGLHMKAVIQKHLVPLLHATTTKLAQHEGQFTDYVELEDNRIRLGATRIAFELLGAFEGVNESAEKRAIDYIVVDMPMQKWPDEKLETVEVAAKSGPAKPAPKKDPRPQD